MFTSIETVVKYNYYNYYYYKPDLAQTMAPQTSRNTQTMLFEAAEFCPLGRREQHVQCFTESKIPGIRTSCQTQNTYSKWAS